ncbi:ABC transporter substrate-binding protein [Microbacterium sp. A196]|uniref:ABC transporter substrate-binding protein n=1 Tax=Microbacterium sp. A196 TaxID=3457320 RepID=UPI003FD0F823
MKHTIKAIAIAAPLALVLAACSATSGGGNAGDTGGDAGSKVSEVTLSFLGDISGAAAFCGGEAQTGFEAAIDWVNENDLAGGVTIKADIRDTQTDPKVAATEVQSIASTDSVGAVIGCASGVAQATAAAAQSVGLPIVAMQSGSQAVIDAGDHIFRATAPQSTFHNSQAEYYIDKGIKSVALVTQSDNPTLVEVAETVYPPLFEEAGVEIVANETFLGTDTDFTALASKVVGADPDLVLLFGQGTPNVTISTAILNQGYDGFVGGSAGFANGVLEPLGASADGFTWPTDFSVDGPAESTQDFVTYYKDKTGNVPGAFAAETWDAVLLFAYGIANAAEPDNRESVLEGIREVTSAGFDGAVGPISFDDRDARIDGILVEWRDGAVNVVS